MYQRRSLLGISRSLSLMRFEARAMEWIERPGY
jgi:hypothetical protein